MEIVRVPLSDPRQFFTLQDDACDIFSICSTERKFIPFAADICKGKRPWFLMPSIQCHSRAEVKSSDISLDLRKADVHLARNYYHHL